MDAMISKILEIEARACGLVREAEERKLDISGIIEEEKKRLLKSNMEQAKQRLEKERAEILKSAEEESETHLARSAEKVKSMDAFRSEHFDEWVQTLYERITAV